MSSGSLLIQCQDNTWRRSGLRRGMLVVSLTLLGESLCGCRSTTVSANSSQPQNIDSLGMSTKALVLLVGKMVNRMRPPSSYLVLVGGDSIYIRCHLCKIKRCIERRIEKVGKVTNNSRINTGNPILTTRTKETPTLTFTEYSLLGHPLQRERKRGSMTAANGPCTVFCPLGLSA